MGRRQERKLFPRTRIRFRLRGQCVFDPNRLVRTDNLWIDSLDHQDKIDALTCALLAHAFTLHQEMLAAPPDTISTLEGWI